MTHQLVLSSDGVKKPRYHTSDIPEHIHKGDLGAAAMLARMLNSYLDIGLIVHLHVGVRWLTGDVDRYCAVVEYPTRELRDAAAEGFGSTDAHLSISEIDQPPKMDKSVLVLIPEIVEGEDRFGKRIGPLRIRLQPLNECGWSRSESTDHKTSPVLKSDDSSTGLSSHENRELGTVELFSFVVNGEPVDALVESRSEVVDSFAEDDAPQHRNRLIQLQAEQVLRSTRAYFMYEAIWLTVLPSPYFRLEQQEVIVRSLDLLSDGLYGSGINSHTPVTFGNT